MFQTESSAPFDRNSKILPRTIQKHLSGHFSSIWNEERKYNKKLGFYNSVKDEFGVEAYIEQDISHKEQKCLAQLRMSADKLKIETGRYQLNRQNSVNRACPTCTNVDNAQLLSELPCFEPIVEDELHVLLTCSKYHDIRSSLNHGIKTGLFMEQGSLFNKDRIWSMAKYVRKIFNRRFPKAASLAESEKKSILSDNQEPNNL